MTLCLSFVPRRWPLREPFGISRGVQHDVSTLVVTVRDADGLQGRGEGCGVDYAGETAASMAAQIQSIRGSLRDTVDRSQLLELLPPGGARFALDSALWDLEAKRSGISAFRRAGVALPGPVDTAYTIGIRPAAAYRAAAQSRAEHRLLKLKVDAADPLAAVAAAREGAPNSGFIVDPNQSWTVDQVKAFAPPLAALGVVLLEQPIAIGAEAGLDGYDCPIPLCADELVAGIDDIGRVAGRFDYINIKLDKTGGLTAALRLADAAEAAGLGLMVGCMVGSSLAMAPAMILAQRCSFVDLDGPLLQAEDWEDGMRYLGGQVFPPEPSFWG